ncbi:FFLEELY motif protein [Rhodoferax sediminis]|jgi:hypothetical protein|uniref:DUF8198 domain-containing protein n=1 Tax=Rhodoferax sediminis TaxID=2509614 RepID=A0A515D702_9BURK|nr:hypothetical protein [Rhodoferax sediminis]QDL36180.1 hypothetical protein EUB48_01880 [Rhodoferax sediminis]
MEPAQQIRDAVAQVSQLRQDASGDPALGAAVAQVKRLQSRRFTGTYADLLGGGPYQAAAQFFLYELYGEADYSERDAQFARIAGALQRLFPQQVMATAVSLAQLHALTERLDHAMGRAWPHAAVAAGDTLGESPAARYIRAWRTVAQRGDREAQLTVVLEIGHELQRLTRMPGLRLMLKMMRGPAAAAGMGALQRFLEAGFDTFAAMARQPGGADGFMATIREREAALIALLFDADFVACETQLAHTLGQAR